MGKGKNRNQNLSQSGAAQRGNALAAKLEASLIDQLRPGRHPCSCDARIHALVRNCMGCGKVVCKQEGSGPCFFCGTLVCSREEREIIERGSRQSNDLYRKLMGTDYSGKDLNLSSIGADYIKAAQFKDKLLDADADSERKTKVNDLQSDYSSLEKSAFLTAEERKRIIERRQELIEKRNKERRSLTVNLDIVNLTIQEKKKEHLSIDINNDPIIQNILQKSDDRRRAAESMHSTALDADWVPKGFIPKYDITVGDKFETNKHILSKVNIHSLQDSEVSHYDTENRGYVVVLKQPLASLVAHGTVRMFRWPEDIIVRGPVFIASDSYAPSTHELDTAIKSGKKDIDFVSCAILGRVFIEDCLSKSEYQAQNNPIVPPGDGDFVLSISNTDPFVNVIEHVSLADFYQVDEQLRRILSGSYTV